MDERNIEKKLKDRFDRYEDPVYDEGNWEKLSQTLDTISDVPSSPFFHSKNLLKIGLALALVSNLILVTQLFKQKNQLEELLSEQEDIRQHEVLVPEDKDSLTDIAAHNTLHKVTVLKNPLIKSLETDSTHTARATRKVSMDTFDVTADLRNGQINASTTLNGENTFHGTSVLQTPVLLSSETLRVDPLNFLDSPIFLMPINPYPGVKSSREKQVHEMYNSNSDMEKSEQLLSPGIFVGLPRISTDISKAEPGYRFGIDLELRVRNRLFLIVGGSYSLLSYKIDDHGKPEDLNELLSTYPVISEDQSIRNLHEVFSKAQTLEFPLGIRYKLNNGTHLHPFIEGGLYGRLFFKQSFEYEYSISESHLLREIEIKDKNLSFGGIYASVGNRFRLNHKLTGQLSLFYNQDLVPQGSEGRKYNLWGIKGAIRLAPSQ